MIGVSRTFEHRSEKEVVEKVCKTLFSHTMIQQGETVIIGVSGGVDSMCLLDILHRIQRRHSLGLVAAHLHHGLRGVEAEQDYRFVQEQASRYGVPFEGERLNATDFSRSSNVQATARELRYQFYEEVAKKWNAQKIATGHHLDDQVETLLLQIFRGTGTLKGIRPVRGGRYIRPLLDVCRQDILVYAKQRKIAHREDSSNLKTTYLRNRIRHQLVPWIRKEINPSFSRSLINLSSLLRSEHECMDVLAKQAYAQAREKTPHIGEVVLKRNVLETLEPSLTKRVLREAYRNIRGSTQGLSYVHVQKVCEILQGKEREKHRKLSLPDGIDLFVEHERILFSRLDVWSCTPYHYHLPIGEDLFIPEAGVRLHATRVPTKELPTGKHLDPNRAFLYPGSTTAGMVVRNFRTGDRFRPLGMHGSKKLKDYFIDQKIPRSFRCRLPILEVDGKIAWVVGFRMDERFKVNQHVQNCIQIDAVNADVYSV